MNGYSAFLKVYHHQIILYHIQDTCSRGSYSSAEMQPMYSTAASDRALMAIKEYYFVPRAPEQEPYHRI